MLRIKKALFTLIFVLLLFPAISLKGASASGDPPQPKKVIVYREDLLDIAKELHPPGCTDSMTADYCELPTAFALRDEIYEMLSQGKKKDQIIDALVAKYGERVLASPSTQGFNLIAWTLPGIAVVAGGVSIGILVRRWVRDTSESFQMDAVDNGNTLTEEQKEKVNKELKDWI